MNNYNNYSYNKDDESRLSSLYKEFYNPYNQIGLNVSYNNQQFINFNNYFTLMSK